MNYSVNPVEFSSIFAVPASVADKHIKLASEYQIKALLLFLKNHNDTQVYSLIGKRLGLDEKEIAECLDYWVVRGVLCDNSGKVKAKNDVKDSPNNSAPTSKPTREEAITRIASSEELQYLTQVAQEKLSRPITASELRTFVWIYDQYGLPVPVIIMAIQFAVDEGKGNFSYIEKVCVDWAKNEINTLSRAEQKISALYLSKTAWKIVESAFGISHRKASTTEAKLADKWVNEFAFNKDMLIAAYDICVDNTKKVNYKYINTVLENWHKKGYKKPDDIENERISEEKKKPSYNKAKIQKKLNNFD